MAEHCGLPMLEVYERKQTEDRFELALSVEVVDVLYQCTRCGAKLTTHLEQPVRAAVS
jgi:hypothetical protein